MRNRFPGMKMKTVSTQTRTKEMRNQLGVITWGEPGTQGYSCKKAEWEHGKVGREGKRCQGVGGEVGWWHSHKYPP